MSKVVPCLVDGGVQDDKCTTWSERVAEEFIRLSVDAVVRGYIGLVDECAHHVQVDLCLRNEFVPEVDWERRVSACKDCNEVTLEGLYRPFCFVRSFCKRWHEFVLNVLRYEVLMQAFRCFVVHDFELDVVSKLGKSLESAGVGVNDG